MSKTFKIFVLILIIGVVFGFGLNNKGAAQEELPIFVKEEPSEKIARPLYVPDEIVVKFKPGVKKEDVENFNRQKGVEEKYESPYTHFKVLKIPPLKTVEEMVEIYKKNPNIEYAEPNYYAYATMVPNDPYYSLQWHFDNATYGGIQMEQAWDITTGSSSVIVAVVDTGVAYEDYPAPGHCHIDTYQAYGGSGNSWWCGLNNPNWSTPPGYGNSWKDYLQHSFDLTGASGTITFSYQYRHDLEVTAGTAYDKAFTEISTDGGDNWIILKTYTKDSKVQGQVGWKAESLNLTSYAGQNVLIRFRVYTDETYSDEDGFFNSDGAFFVDEITLEDGSGNLFYDDVELGPGTWEATQYKQAPDLAGTNFVAGYDYINGDTHANDDNSHGTHVAGTIAQTTNNSLGVAGVAFNTTIMPIKVLDAAGSGTWPQVADGIYYAVDNGAKVINMSLGGPSSSVLENAVAYAYINGVTVIAACGNSNVSSCDYPAAYNDYVIAVGATQYNETRAPYSSYGSSLDIVAPGGNTGVDQNGDGYVDGILQNTFGDTPVDWAYWFFQGTSMSTPHVSGVVALLLAQDSTRTPDDIRNILQTTAEDKGGSGWDQYYGWGLVDAYAALTYAPAVSITLTTDGLVEFGVVALGVMVDSSGDVQTVSVNTGPVNLDVKSTVFSDNGNSWSLDSTNGANQVKWEFSPDASTWNTFSTPDILYDLANNVAQGNTQNLYLRITMPTATDSSAQYSSIVTIVATAAP